MPIRPLPQGCFKFGKQLGETFHGVALCDDDVQDHLCQQPFRLHEGCEISAGEGS